jgi:hypothetical protein
MLKMAANERSSRHAGNVMLVLCYYRSEASTPYRIAASSISMFMPFRVLNLMQYPLTFALPIFFP